MLDVWWYLRTGCSYSCDELCLWGAAVSIMYNFGSLRGSKINLFIIDSFMIYKGSNESFPLLPNLKEIWSIYISIKFSMNYFLCMSTYHYSCGWSPHCHCNWESVAKACARMSAHESHLIGTVCSCDHDDALKCRIFLTFSLPFSDFLSILYNTYKFWKGFY